MPQFTHSSLNILEQHSYKVSHFSGIYDASDEVAILSALSPVSGLTLTSNTARTSLVLSWTNIAAKSDAIKVYRKTNNSSYILLTTLSATATTYTDSTIYYRDTYKYKIETDFEEHVVFTESTTFNFGGLNSFFLHQAAIPIDLNTYKVVHFLDIYEDDAETSVDPCLVDFTSASAAWDTNKTEITISWVNGSTIIDSIEVFRKNLTDGGSYESVYSTTTFDSDYVDNTASAIKNYIYKVVYTLNAYSYEEETNIVYATLPITTTINMSAWMLNEVQNDFLVQYYIQNYTATTIDINVGYIQKSFSDALNSDANLIYRFSESLYAGSHLQNTYPATIDSDSHIFNTYTSQFALDGCIANRILLTQPMDANLTNRYLAYLESLTYLQIIVGDEMSSDAMLVNRIAAGLYSDSHLQNTYPTFLYSAATIRRSYTATQNISATLVGRNEEYFSAYSHIQTDYTATLLSASYLQNSYKKTLNSIAYVQGTASVTKDMDASLVLDRVKATQSMDSTIQSLKKTATAPLYSWIVAYDRNQIQIQSGSYIQKPIRNAMYSNAVVAGESGWVLIEE